MDQAIALPNPSNPILPSATISAYDIPIRGMIKYPSLVFVIGRQSNIPKNTNPQTTVAIWGFLE